MLKNYIKIALRGVLKEKAFSLIKIVGLAFGLAACLIITLFLIEDLSFDGMHSKKNRIVRVLTIDSAQGVQSQEVGVSQPGMAKSAIDEIPEVESAVRIMSPQSLPLQYEDRVFNAENAIFSESEFFEIFDFEIIEGQTEDILDEPHSVVLTKTLAEKIFGEESPLGKNLVLNQNTLNVKAVMEDPPINSHIQFDMVRSMVAPEGNEGWANFLLSWQGIQVFTYLLLDEPKTDLQPTVEKLIALKEKHEAYEFFTPTLQRFEDVHLHSKHILFESNFNKTDISNIYILISIGVIILILAAVNFINLVTARASARAREIGVRKVMGGYKKQLVIQHLMESMLVVTFSFLLAVVITLAVIPLLNSLYGRYADIFQLLNPMVIATMIAMVVVLGFISGSYPAFFLSSFKPVQVLKGSFQSGGTGSIVRKSLVVFQFAISIALIIGTMVVYEQMGFIRNRDMGYNRDQVITLPLPTGQMIPQSGVFKDELRRLANIRAVGSSSSQIGQQLGRSRIHPEGYSDEDNFITSAMNIDDAYLPALGMDIVAGRNFDKEITTDSASAVLINEEMATMLQWDDPIGKIIRLQTGNNNGAPTYTELTVVGVIRNFNFATVQHQIEPLYIRYRSNNGVISIKAAEAGMENTLAQIEETWKKVYPQYIFEYSFMDDDFENLYNNEQAFAYMFSHLTGLAILIAVLGLFALSAFTAEQKTKEIGIRKVLGANVSTIVTMLSRDFMILIIVAFVLAAPLAWFFMGQWLDSFVYRIDQNVLVYLLAGLISILVALLTVSWQSIRAAVANPIKALRDE